MDIWILNTRECFKFVIMSHSNIMEENGAHCDVKYGGLAQRVSEDNFSFLPIDHSCGILMKIVGGFLPLS